MVKVDELLERLKSIEVVISNPEELTERIMASISIQKRLKYQTNMNKQTIITALLALS